ncbi:MAG TPA: YraN family protein [Lentisphaeria bacterium]|nr:MAG: hypothetical protein A2X47_02660 [Lentisphaerae bacterium GWF2_38_69]HBM17004.1 YraN family protein [Lentisphaeria bacterium]
MVSHLKLGQKGENLATKLLRAKSFDILKRNFISDNRTGEIDIIARDGEILCFVEVKTRHTLDKGDNSADETWLRKHQAERIESAAVDYLCKIGNPAIKYRFDLIEIEYGKWGLKKVHHWEKRFGMRGP